MSTPEQQAFFEEVMKGVREHDENTSAQASSVIPIERQQFKHDIAQGVPYTEALERYRQRIIARSEHEPQT